MTDVEVGKPAPDVTLLGVDNKEHSLSEFKGQNVVLFFFPKAFTGTCERQISGHSQEIEKFKQLNAVALGVSTDQVPSLNAFAKSCNPNGEVLLLSDFRRRAIVEYGINVEEGGLPNQRATFILDRDGVLRYKKVEDAPGQWAGLDPEYAALQQLQ